MSRVFDIYEPPTYCPVCGKEAQITHALTANPPIYVYSCGCKVRRATTDNTKASHEK